MSGIYFPGVQLSIDPSGGQWIRSELELWLRHAGEFRVSQVIPNRYEAYARIFHPAYAGSHPVTWHEVAAQCGRTVHPEMQWTAIQRKGGAAPAPTGTNPVAGDLWKRPDTGNLGRRQAVALGEQLRRFTTTPQSAWFAIWEGYAMLHEDAQAMLTSRPPGWWRRLIAARKAARRARSLRDGFGAIPKLHCEHRSYLLYRGPLTGIDAFHDASPASVYQSPNLWWPDDRAWCVATEIDFDSTLVGAGRAAIDAVLSSRFEALEVTPETRLDARADRINTRPER